jgi:hypothetical protein
MSNNIRSNSSPTKEMPGVNQSDFTVKRIHPNCIDPVNRSIIQSYSHLSRWKYNLGFRIRYKMKILDEPKQIGNDFVYHVIPMKVCKYWLFIKYRTITLKYEEN